MSGILRIKTSVPPLGGQVLTRPQISERLEQDLHETEGFARRLTLVSAPAGFGKTTLVRSWLATHLRRTAWYSLDEYDNDQSGFWSYVIAALQQVEDGVGQAALEILRAGAFAPEDGFDSRTLLAQLLNDVFSLQAPLFLVLDDLHLINNQQIHKDLIFFVENMPTTLHLVVTTRSDPPWPLFRWRAKGEMAEVRLQELRLTDQEASELICTVKGLAISESQLSALYTKTEGWVTGLQLAAASLGRGADPDEYIKGFAGSHKDLVHFLGEEVFVHQPEDVRQFLLKTSVLGRFCASLCTKVTGRIDSGQVLNTLETHNVFMVPLDEQGVWFRYHQLFRDLLLFHLRRDNPELVADLLSRACEWFLQNDSPGEALKYALEANDLERTAEILHAHYVKIMDSEGFLELLRWPEAIPLDLLKRYPRLLLQKAFFLMVLRGKEDVAECIELAEQLGYEDPEEHREYLGMLWAIKAYHSIYNHNLSEAITNAELALQHLPERNYFWRMAVANFCGDSKYFADNPQDSYGYYYGAHHNNVQQGQPYFALSTGYKMAINLVTLGRIKEARHLVEQMLQLARDSGLARTGKAGSLWALLGEILRENGDLAEAERCIERGLLLIGESDHPILSWNCLYKVGLSYSQADFEGALQTVMRLEEIDRERALPSYAVSATRVWKARILIRQGLLQSAKDVLGSMGVSENNTPRPGRGQAYVVLAKALLATEGRPLAEINGILHALKSQALAGGHVPLQIDTLIHLSLMEEQKGSPEAAENHLLSALELGMKADFFQVFVDELGEIGEILMRAVERLKRSRSPQAMLAYCQRICQWGSQRSRAGISSEVRPTSAAYQGHLVEELSPRELEIVELIDKGMSNQDICDTLYLSMGTVKWHTGNIYAKLGVRGRTQALAVARQIGILS